MGSKFQIEMWEFVGAKKPDSEPVAEIGLETVKARLGSKFQSLPLPGLPRQCHGNMLAVSESESSTSEMNREGAMHEVPFAMIGLRESAQSQKDN
jgi:hypothetical protein